MNPFPPNQYGDEHYPDQFLRDHLKEFYKHLQNNRKMWAVMQIKNAMIRGNRHVFLGKISNRSYKKGKRIWNYKKWKQIESSKYYHKKSNLLITSEYWRNVIDLLKELDFHWYPNKIWERDYWFPSYAELVVIWPSDYHLR